MLYRNFRTRGGGEIDLVCRDKALATLVFVEVKTRTSEAFGSPGEAVSAAQQGRIVRGAQRWLHLLGDHDRKIPYRFDIVEVVLVNGQPDIRLLRDAFQIPERALG